MTLVGSAKALGLLAMDSPKPNTDPAVDVEPIADPDPKADSDSSSPFSARPWSSDMAHDQFMKSVEAFYAERG